MSTRKKLALFVFVDAFGWEILQRHSFLDDILTVKAPLGTIFGYSSTCDPTILTGKLPRDHGHFAFYVYNPSASPFRACRWLSLLPRSLTRRGRVRHWISRCLKVWLGYTGYFQIYGMPFDKMPLFDYSEKRDLYQPGGINSGVGTIFDRLRDENVPFFLSDWRAGEEYNLQKIEPVLQEGQVEFAYLFWAHLDAVLHQYGTDSPHVAKKIEWYDTHIRRLMDTASKSYSDVHLYVFSDHGMTDVHDEFDLIGHIDRSGLRFGDDYAAAFDSTVARFWFLNEGARARMIEVLREVPCGHVMPDEELAEYGCDFPGQTFGEQFFLVNPGVLINPSFMGETRLAGMHGYDPYDRDSVAMFASNVEPNPMPKRLDDLYSVMEREAFG